MNSIFSLSSLLSLPSPPNIPTPCWHLRPHNKCSYHVSSIGHSLSSLSVQFPFTSFHTLHNRRSSISAVTPTEDEKISVINFEDVMEKDWSFLETDDINSDEVHKQKTDCIISSGKVEETSKVLVSIGSEGFIDQLIDSSPCQQLLVVHDSLFVLACIKEKYDKVNCWQGELINVPAKWAAFDVVFLYFLPALPYELSEVFGALAKLCLPGARIIISYPQGRKVLEEQQGQYPDVIVTSLPDKITLQSVAADHSFEMVEFTDEPGFYLAVLKYKATAAL